MASSALLQGFTRMVDKVTPQLFVAKSIGQTGRTSINAPHFTAWLKYYCQVPLFHAGPKFSRPQCAAIMDVYGDHLLHCKRGTHRIHRHDAQIRLLMVDLKKAARRPVLGPRPFGRHRDRPDIRAVGSHEGSDMLDVPICHPLSLARIRDGMGNPLSLLNNALDEKIRRFRRVLYASAIAVRMLHIPISTLRGSHPNALRATGIIAV